jgi:5-(carboxyamino)imidazole ribonucleotide synthase
VNLIGEVPALDALIGRPGFFVHVYGKSPAPGRKLGHITLVANSREALEEQLAETLAVIGDRASERSA